MTALKSLFKKTQLGQNRIADMLKISRGGLSRILVHDVWPVNNVEALKVRMRTLLVDHGIAAKDIDKAFAASVPQKRDYNKEKRMEAPRMLRKQTLSFQAKRHFNIQKEIFSDIFTSHEDLYFSADGRYIREALYHTAKHGGMLAMIGESGSGKSTFVMDLYDRVARETNSRMILIKPYVLGMEDTSKSAYALKASHITDAILSQLGSDIGAGFSPERRFKMLHSALVASAQAGFRHCLIIEEAHALGIKTIKHLKRFYELEMGLTRLVSIILVGQTELKDKLSESVAAVREVVQRMELLAIHPMDDLEGYVRHRCTRAGADFEKIFAADALDALSIHLSGPSSRDGKQGVSLLYPLAVNNTLTMAINIAAELGMEKVTADAVRRA